MQVNTDRKIVYNCTHTEIMSLFVKVSNAPVETIALNIALHGLAFGHDKLYGRWDAEGQQC